MKSSIALLAASLISIKAFAENTEKIQQENLSSVTVSDRDSVTRLVGYLRQAVA